MTAQKRVNVLRLHCEYVRTLLAHLCTDLTTLEQALAANGKSSEAIIAMHMEGLEKQGEHVALEVVRLQGFIHALEEQSEDTPTANEES